MSSNNTIPVEKLKELKKLLDDEIITEAEFEQKKRQLLGLEVDSSKRKKPVEQQKISRVNPSLNPYMMQTQNNYTIPDSYKQSSLNAFIDIYKEGVRNLQIWVVNSLDPKDVVITSDGTVTVGSHYSDAFIPISCEVMLFVQAALIENAMTRPELFDSEMIAKLKASFGNESFFSSGNKWGMSEETFSNRIDEYIKCTTEKLTTGASFPEDIEPFDNAQGRKTGMFADCVVSHETMNAIEPYEKVAKAAKEAKKESSAVDIANAGLKMYRELLDQTYPYLSGSVMVFERDKKGVCPCCGGSYKGILTKQCSKCGMGKNEAETFAKQFFTSPFSFPPGGYN